MADAAEVNSALAVVTSVHSFVIAATAASSVLLIVFRAAAGAQGGRGSDVADESIGASTAVGSEVAVMGWSNVPQLCRLVNAWGPFGYCFNLRVTLLHCLKNAF